MIYISVIMNLNELGFIIPFSICIFIGYLVWYIKRGIFNRNYQLRRASQEPSIVINMDNYIQPPLSNNYTCPQLDYITKEPIIIINPGLENYSVIKNDNIFVIELNISSTEKINEAYQRLGLGKLI